MDRCAICPILGLDSAKLDLKTLALVRIGALVAVGGAVPSNGAEVDAAGECLRDARRAR